MILGKEEPELNLTKRGSEPSEVQGTCLAEAPVQDRVGGELHMLCVARAQSAVKKTQRRG